MDKVKRHHIDVSDPEAFCAKSKDKEEGTTKWRGKEKESGSKPTMTRVAEDGWPTHLHKGRFTEYCKRNGFEGPSAECAAHARKSGDKSVEGMAAFYTNTVKP